MYSITDTNHHLMHIHIFECLHHFILPFCSEAVHHCLPGMLHTQWAKNVKNSAIGLTFVEFVYLCSFEAALVEKKLENVDFSLWYKRQSFPKLQIFRFLAHYALIYYVYFTTYLFIITYLCKKIGSGFPHMIHRLLAFSRTHRLEWF